MDFTRVTTHRRHVPAGVDIIIISLFFAVAFFYSLGKAPLMAPDEARYAEIPREMIELGDFITPHLNYVRYFEKPPLYYWLNVVSFRLFGETEFAARFFSALAGLLGIVITWHIGRAIYGRREGLLAALILGTSIGYLVQGRLTIIDMTLTCLMTASLGSFLLAARDGEPHKGFYYRLFYGCAALAVLTKGLVGIVLPGMITVSYMLLARRGRLLKEMRLLTGLSLFLLISVPWFVMVAVKNQGFARFFFIHEHLARFLTMTANRYQPAWFFIPVFLGSIFPWSCFIPATIARLIRERKCAGNECDLFLAIWVAVIVCFFSLSSSKLVPYILPVYPAAALLIGKTISMLLDGEFRLIRKEAYFLHIILLSGAVGILLYPFLASTPGLSATGCMVCALLFLCEALLIMVFTRRANAAGIFLSLCLMTYLQGIIGPPFILARMQEKKSIKELALIVKEKAGPEDRVVVFGFYPQDVPFYTKRRIVCVQVKNELELGSSMGDQTSWFIDYPQFYKRWDSPESFFVLIDERDLPVFKKAVKTPINLLGRKGDRLLVANRDTGSAAKRSDAHPPPVQK